MDEIGISANVTGDINAALGQIEDNLDDVGDAGVKMGAKVRAGGAAAAQGMDKVQKSTERARDANGRFLPTGHQVTEQQQRQTRATLLSAAALDRYSRKARKAMRTAGGLAAVLMTVKWSIFLTGGLAAVGMLSALGAAAAIAIGGLAPMVGVFAALGPLVFGLVASMFAFKLAGEQVGQTLQPLKDDFKSYGDDIRAVLLPGLRTMVSLMRDQLVPVLGGGLVNVADILGDISAEFGEWSTQANTLNRFGAILQGMGPILRPLATGFMSIFQAILDITESALPMAGRMITDFAWVARNLALWTTAMRENGRMAAWLNKSYDIFLRTMGLLVDITIGLYNVFRIAGGFAGDMGNSVEELAYKFRLWTESAQGQQRIAQYFRDSLPAIREMALILGSIVGWFASLAANQNVAPLLAQIRNELLPALAAVADKVVGAGGLGPALISAFTAIAQAVAAIPPGPMLAVVEALAGLIASIGWLLVNVPGLGTAVAYVAAALMAWKIALVVGVAVLKTVGMILDIISVVGTVAGWVGKAVMLLGKAFLFLGRALLAAFMANPVIAIIVIIVGLILWLWFNCEWFRDALIAAWEWIAAAAVTAWNWIVDAVGIAIDWIADKAKWLWEHGLKPIWEIISTAAKIYWEIWVAIITTAIDVIVTVVTWLWTNVIKPVWEAISSAAAVAWDIISFVVQTAVFIIVGIIIILAHIAETTWKAISAAAEWAWGIITGVVDTFVGYFGTFIDWIVGLWNGLVDQLSQRWTWFYETILKPVIDFFVGLWNSFTLGVSTKWTELTTLMAAAWTLFYEAYIKPVIDGFKSAWEVATAAAGLVWEMFTTGISDRWNAFKDMVGGVIDWIKDKWETAVSWLGDFFSPIADGIAKAWEGISKGAEIAADLVKGAWNAVTGVVKGAWNGIANGWNSIPSITVPEWVPGMGGKTFSLPKLPMLWKGGEAPGGAAIVGEHGPEPLVRNGQFAGMVGMNGPEVASIPRGGYVVPNLDTLSRLPGLTKSLPSSVADAVSRSVPGYGDLLERGRGPALRAPDITVKGDDDGTVGVLRELVGAVREARPPMNVGSNATKSDVLAALRQHDREKRTAKRYEY
jgi:hypothetical protein